MSRSRRELFGFHRPADTPVHRAPLALKAAGIAIVSALLMIPFPWLLGLLGVQAPAAAWAVPAGCLVLVLAAALAARIGPRGWWHSIRPAAWILALLGAYHLLLRRDPAMAAEVLLTVVTALLATRVLLETTPLPELLDGLVRLLSPLRRVGVDPQRIGLAIQIMLRTIPFLTGVVDDLRDAAAARGVRLGPVALASPLVISAVAHGQRTGEAVAARGLDSPPDRIRRTGARRDPGHGR
ncbi:energy-coupling factor transporter transmembrane protein EcfT [Kocuria palustris]|uniref:energy-coupling factor transporter transmembrane component T family protein n=1 Tax=Kocuria palustris TaxID=71999 RepID=UPI0011A76114|nr:energy-coupling factor transporter transmembrane protein EcfT [Kocuria palustris]